MEKFQTINAPDQVDGVIYKDISTPPQNLDQARSAVLKTIPGLAFYIPDIEAPLVEVDKNLDKMVEEVTFQLAAENETALIKQNMGWSDREADEFFADSARTPYKSSVQLSGNSAERSEQLAVIGQYAVQRYATAKEEATSSPQDEDKKRMLQKSKENLRNFFMESLNNLYAPAVFAFNDKFNGIDPKDRRVGTIEPTPDMIALMKGESTKVAQELGIDETQVYEGVLAATEGGNFSTIRTYFEGNKGNPAVRRALEGIYINRHNDRELEREKINILWGAETYRHAIGLSLGTYYEVNNNPTPVEQDQKIHEYLQKPSFVGNVWKHLKDEAPAEIALAQAENRPINYFAVLTERARVRNLPDVVSTTGELNTKITGVKAELSEVFPLGFEESLYSMIGAPTSKGAEPRAVNINYRNSHGESVNIVILNPRVSRGVLKTTMGHELTHKTHKELVKRAEDAGLLPKGSMEGLDNQLKENFALFIQEQIRLLDNPAKPASEGSTPSQDKWRDIVHATLMRRQGPFALNQKGLRQEMDRLWESGKRGSLRDSETDAILDTFRPQLDAWFAEGVDIAFPHQSISFNTNATRPNDGLIYLGNNELNNDPSAAKVAGSTTKIENKKAKPVGLSMEQAFIDRFGSHWILQKDARTILLALFVESGKNHDLSTYSSFVQNTDIEGAKRLLSSLGVSENLI